MVDLPTRHAADETVADRPPSAAIRGRSATVDAYKTRSRGRSTNVDLYKAGAGADRPSSTVEEGWAAGGRLLP